MNHQDNTSVLHQILNEIAREIRAKIIMEPEWKIAGQIVFKNGHKSYFKFNSLDINPFGSANLAKDKDYSNFFMQASGYRTIPKSKTFFSDSWGLAVGRPEQNIAAAYKHAEQLGWPVITKPNSGHQGIGVSLVYNKNELSEAMKEIFKSDNIALVQPFVIGNDYRIVVLDDEIITAYQRLPLSVNGDDKSTIEQLIKMKQAQLAEVGRSIKIRSDDRRIKNKLKHQDLTLDSIPRKDQVVYLLDNANLSTGGDAIDITKMIHPGFAKLAIALTRDMNLRLCGVDLIINGSISNEPKAYWILEINAAPGLDHYARLGKEQIDIVKNLYKKVLKHMEKGRM